MNIKLNKSQMQTATIFAVAAAMMMTPTAAFAEGSALEGVTGVAETILNFMRGPIASAAGAIAIAFVGYRWFSGRMELGRAAATVAGIVLVIGSVQIVAWIRAADSLDTPIEEGSIMIEMPAEFAAKTILFSEQI